MKNLLLALSLVSTSAMAQGADTKASSEVSSPAAESLEKANSAENQKPEEQMPSQSTSVAPEKSQYAGMILPWGKIGVVASASFPQFLELGIDSRIMKWFGVGFGFGPKMGTTVSSTEIGISHWALNANVHPFQGAFFVGVSYGNQEITAKAKVDLENAAAPGAKVPTTIDIKVKSSFLTPKLGWHGLWDMGLTVGTEFGYQMPQSAESTVDAMFEGIPQATVDQIKSQPDYIKEKDNAEKVANQFGKTGLPHWKVIQLGWLF